FEVRRAYGDTGRPLAEVVSALDTAVDALAYAHAQGIVHRDVNPGNIFLTHTPAGIRTKVLDFGVAKIMEDSAIELGPGIQTLGHIRIFSPTYAAPEQFDDRIGAIGPWTDTYSIAMIVLEGLRDRPAIEGETLGEIAARVLDTAVRPSPRTLGVALGDDV